MNLEEYLTAENVKMFLPVVVAVTTFFTAIVTFVLTSFFTIYKDKKKNNADHRAYFEYGEHEMYFPISDENLKFHGEGMVLFGENGSKFKQAAKQGKTFAAFMILHNRTENDLLNVRIKTVYTSSKPITEEFVLPYWRSEEAIYLFQSDFDGSTHYSTNEELTIEFTTKTLEKLRFSWKRIEKGVYKEVYQKRFFIWFWRDMINYNHSNFFTYQKLRIEVPKDKNTSTK